MFYGGFGSMSYSTSEEPCNIDLEASEFTVFNTPKSSLSSCTACKRTLGVLLPRMKDFHNILLRNPKVSGG